MSSTPRSQLGNSVTTRRLEPKIIETVYAGHISAEMAEQVKGQLVDNLALQPGSHWLIDAGSATGIQPAKEYNRLAVFRAFEENGGGRIAVVVKSGPLRMMSATFSFALGLKMKAFEERGEALEYLRSLP